MLITGEVAFELRPMSFPSLSALPSTKGCWFVGSLKQLMEGPPRLAFPQVLTAGQSKRGWPSQHTESGEAARCSTTKTVTSAEKGEKRLK